jgi:hypothetical protein
MRHTLGTRNGKRTFVPSDEKMWALWTGTCMNDRCTHNADSQITLQLHWRDESSVWAFCAGHAHGWIRLMLALKPHYLQYEPWGTVQEPLPFEGAETIQD